jgi:hypothetical protein
MRLPVTIDHRIARTVAGLGDRLNATMPHTRNVYASAGLLDQISRGVLKR